jgi:hypothetical protein
MTEKRFELTMRGNEVAQYEIIDHSQEILTVYNNLGNVYFSSAMKICELLNSLADENEQLKQQLASVNRLIDNKIDEFKNGDYGDLPCNTIHMFLDLKQEIGDVE